MKDLDLLLENAWFLMKHHSEILLNEEWRNIQVDIDNGLTVGALPRPTIGAYLKYWMEDGCVRCFEKYRATDCGVSVGTHGLVCRIIGNAGTGTNSCRVVWEYGTITSECFTPFWPIRNGYIEACRIYPRNSGAPIHDLKWLINKLKNKYNDNEYQNTPHKH